MENNPTKMAILSRYPESQKKDYIFVLAHAFSEFEERPAEECALFNDWVLNFRIPQEYHSQLNQIIDGDWLDKQYTKRIERLVMHRLADPLLLDSMALAMSDGVLMDDEVDALRNLATAMNVSSVHFNIYLELIHSAYQAAYLENPEPLFEHNIEQALNLLCQRRVVLFEHAKLCTCSKDYNGKIKQHWLRMSQHKRAR